MTKYNIKTADEKEKISLLIPHMKPIANVSMKVTVTNAVQPV